MSGVLLALRRSFGSLARGRVWLYLLGPVLVALLLMVGLSVALLDRLITVFVEQPPMSWVVAWGAVWLAHLLAALGGWLLILAASYLVAIFLTAVFVLPLLLGEVSQADYRELERQGSDSFSASLWNSGWAAVLFVMGWLLTLPLWLVPGMGLVLPLFWMAWLNRRTFAYDALAVHATDAEWRSIRRAHAFPLLGLGLLMALLVYLPFIGLLAPALAALAYVHYCLEALRCLRQGADADITERQEGNA